MTEPSRKSRHDHLVNPKILLVNTVMSFLSWRSLCALHIFKEQKTEGTSPRSAGLFA